MAEKEPIKAPVEGQQDKLAVCSQYFEKIIRKIINEDDKELLREIGVCFNADYQTFYLAVNPETGETGANLADRTNLGNFLSYLKALKSFDPNVTPAQALTSLITQPIFLTAKHQFPPEFNQLEIISVSIKN